MTDTARAINVTEWESLNTEERSELIGWGCYFTPEAVKHYEQEAHQNMVEYMNRTKRPWAWE